jgi:hypothetical protein
MNTRTVSDGGTNYGTGGKTQITISGGGGSGTLASSSISGGVISSITMLNPGTGFNGPLMLLSLLDSAIHQD